MILNMNITKYELLIILLPPFDVDRIDMFCLTVIDILDKLKIKAFIVKTWRNNLDTNTRMAWYLHFIIDTQFVLTTCFIKRVKQSIKFEGIITRWHLFCICLDKTYKELIVCDINISMGCQLFKKINKKTRNKNTSKCSNGSNDGSFQELKWPWLLKPYDRYKDMTFLQNYITDYGEILSRKITKLNNKTHRKLCKEIKRYRNLGLISKTKPILEEGQDSDI